MLIMKRYCKYFIRLKLKNYVEKNMVLHKYAYFTLSLHETPFFQSAICRLHYIPYKLCYTLKLFKFCIKFSKCNSPEKLSFKVE